LILEICRKSAEEEVSGTFLPEWLHRTPSSKKVPDTFSVSDPKISRLTPLAVEGFVQYAG
jgi:hypothetical protein